MSEGMVEKVAASIAAAGGSNWSDCLKAPGQRMAAMYRSMARAAIGAMQEPTPEMLLAAWNSNGPAGDDDEYRLLWQAMIDAALNEGKSREGRG